MSDTVDEILNTEEINTFVLEFEERINNYLKYLKKQSSEEILSGSIQKAQMLINKILQLENGITKVNVAHDNFLKIINGNNSHDIGSEAIMKKFKGETEANKNSNKEFKDTTHYRLRVSILKALIYLGGSAGEEDLIEYIRKESLKNTKDRKMLADSEEHDLNSLFKNEVELMEKENLITSEKSVSRWSISQTGIDYLARYE